MKNCLLTNSLTLAMYTAYVASSLFVKVKKTCLSFDWKWQKLFAGDWRPKGTYLVGKEKETQTRWYLFAALFVSYFMYCFLKFMLKNFKMLLVYKSLTRKLCREKWY
jgi:hypothetical protein